jgi:hypothetical protein
MIIESPHIDIAKHQTPIHPALPPLYTNLPNDLPKEVIDYVEKRNNYIRQLSDKYANFPNESRNSLIIKSFFPMNTTEKRILCFYLRGRKKLD